jgi:polar amino acid transport system substrate-binding protein
MNLSRLALALALLLLAARDGGAESLTVIGSEFPPLSFLEAGRPAGTVTSKVQRILTRAGLSVPIDIMPWPRAIRTAEAAPDIAIFPIGRTPEREARFLWIGKLTAYDVFLWRNADRPDIVLSRVEDAARYAVGGINGDLKAVYLERHGVTLTWLGAGDLGGLAMLARGRLDLVPLDRITLPERARMLGLDAATFVPALALPELSQPLYLALSPRSSPALAARLGEALAAEAAAGD